MGGWFPVDGRGGREGGREGRAYRGSSGCTHTAVSPNMVSGRVVATGMCSSLPSTMYLK